MRDDTTSKRDLGVVASGVKELVRELGLPAVFETEFGTEFGITLVLCTELGKEVHKTPGVGIELGIALGLGKTLVVADFIKGVNNFGSKICGKDRRPSENPVKQQ